MNTENKNCGANGEYVELTVADRWIRSRLLQVAGEVETAFSSYRFDLASQAIYSFIWDEYCSWYLELSKRQLATAMDGGSTGVQVEGATAMTGENTSSAEARVRATRQTLVLVLETSLRLLHPIMPFITEEIWQRAAPLAGVTGPSIMLQPYPRMNTINIDHNALAEMEWIKQFINGIRNLRGEYNVSPAQPLAECLIEDASTKDQDYLNRHSLLLTGGLTPGSLTKVVALKFLTPGQTPPPSAVFLLGAMKVHVPLGSLIDKHSELKRLQKEMEKTRKELDKAQNKLTNADFIDRAPAAVIEQEKQRVQEFEATLTHLDQQRVKVLALSE